MSLVTLDSPLASGLSSTMAMTQAIITGQRSRRSQTASRSLEAAADIRSSFSELVYGSTVPGRDRGRIGPPV